MKVLSLFCLCLGLALPVSATVSIEFQLGGIEVPAGSIGVLVADVSNDGFSPLTEAVGSTLAFGSMIGSDVVIAVFSNSGLSDWGSQEGFAEHIAVLDYESLDLAQGDDLTLHVFPDRDAGQAIRTGEPHLSYRTEDIGQFTSNSTIKTFSLPADGGAHLLAVLGSAAGGGADLSGIDMSAFPYASGNGNLNRSLGPTGRHTYFFDVSAPGFLSLEGLGGTGLVTELYAPDGQLVASGNGDAFELYEALVAGIYTLVVYREAGGTGDLAYGLDFANADTRNVVPDVSVGPGLSSLTGRNVLNGAPGQISTLISTKANPVGGVAAVANQGKLPDTLAVRCGAGSVLCGIAYFDTSGNVTAGLLTGAYRTAEIAETDDAVSIRVQFAPNKRKLIKKGKKKPKISKQVFPALVRADSTQGTPAMDAATIQVQTK